MPTKLTQKEMVCNAHTLEHILNVNKFLNMFIVELLKRGQNHDQTKLDHPEVEHFAENAEAGDDRTILAFRVVKANRENESNVS